jgi:alkaline phosphatase
MKRSFLCALAFAAFAIAPAAAGDKYFDDGQATLKDRKAQKPNAKRARNVILFVGDGMDPTTLTAARIYDGQSRGEQGEENFLSFERFPYLAMAKTYNTNAQTPDSAGTMSAMTTGVKTKMGVISLTDATEVSNCQSSKAAGIATFAELAERAGLSTGVVSTARLTHATPAAVYAHAPDRDWERDTNLTEEARANGCKDIASQLIDFKDGDGIDVAMGGGRANFLPAEMTDPENSEKMGGRRDGRDLAAAWVAKSSAHKFVWNKAGFDAINPAEAPRVLGLFEQSHMQYELDRSADKGGEPSLAEMTTKAIEILRNDKDGFLLVVEAGRIDHAHHAGNAARALEDTKALSEAVAAARSMTAEKDTLIIVTADHGHTISMAGYPKKGNPILGLATATLEDAGDANGYALAADKKPYTTLSYANGPGSVLSGDMSTGRPTLTQEQATDSAFRQQSLVPSPSETHGGQDVTIYASGPRAHYFSGLVEQSYVFHVIDDALGLRARAGKAPKSR